MEQGSNELDIHAIYQAQASAEERVNTESRSEPVRWNLSHLTPFRDNTKTFACAIRLKHDIEALQDLVECFRKFDEANWSKSTSAPAKEIS